MEKKIFFSFQTEKGKNYVKINLMFKKAARKKFTWMRWCACYALPCVYVNVDGGFSAILFTLKEKKQTKNFFFPLQETELIK